MSIRSISTIVAAILIAVFTTGCGGGGDDSGDQAQSVAETAGADAGQSFEQMKAAYVSTVKDVMEDWNQKIAALEEKKKQLPDAAQTAVETPMKELLDMRDVLGAKIDALENATQESYHNAQVAVDEELGAINNAYDKVTGMLK